jgi:hypothetical protein
VRQIWASLFCSGRSSFFSDHPDFVHPVALVPVFGCMPGGWRRLISPAQWTWVKLSFSAPWCEEHRWFCLAAEFSCEIDFRAQGLYFLGACLPVRYDGVSACCSAHLGLGPVAAAVLFSLLQFSHGRFWYSVDLRAPGFLCQPCLPPGARQVFSSVIGRADQASVHAPSRESKRAPLRFRFPVLSFPPVSAARARVLLPPGLVLSKLGSSSAWSGRVPNPAFLSP